MSKSLLRVIALCLAAQLAAEPLLADLRWTKYDLRFAPSSFVHRPLSISFESEALNPAEVSSQYSQSYAPHTSAWTDRVIQRAAAKESSPPGGRAVTASLLADDGIAMLRVGRRPDAFKQLFGLSRKNFEKQVAMPYSNKYWAEVKVWPMPDGKNFVIVSRAWRRGKGRSTGIPAGYLITAPRTNPVTHESAYVFYECIRPGHVRGLEWPEAVVNAVVHRMETQNVRGPKVKPFYQIDFEEANRYAAAGIFGMERRSNASLKADRQQFSSLMDQFELYSAEFLGDAISELGYLSKREANAIVNAYESESTSQRDAAQAKPVDEKKKEPKPPAKKTSRSRKPVRKGHAPLERTAEGKIKRSAEWVQAQRIEVQNAIARGFIWVPDLRPVTLLNHRRDNDDTRKLFDIYIVVQASVRKDDPPIYANGWNEAASLAPAILGKRKETTESDEDYSGESLRKAIRVVINRYPAGLEPLLRAEVMVTLETIAEAAARLLRGRLDFRTQSTPVDDGRKHREDQLSKVIEKAMMALARSIRAAQKSQASATPPELEADDPHEPEIEYSGDSLREAVRAVIGRYPAGLGPLLQGEAAEGVIVTLEDIAETAARLLRGRPDIEKVGGTFSGASAAAADASPKPTAIIVKPPRPEDYANGIREEHIQAAIDWLLSHHLEVDDQKLCVIFDMTPTQIHSTPGFDDKFTIVRRVLGGGAANLTDDQWRITAHLISEAGRDPTPENACRFLGVTHPSTWTRNNADRLHDLGLDVDERWLTGGRAFDDLESDAGADEEREVISGQVATPSAPLRLASELAEPADQVQAAPQVLSVSQFTADFVASLTNPTGPLLLAAPPESPAKVQRVEAEKSRAHSMAGQERKGPILLGPVPAESLAEEITKGAPEASDGTLLVVPSARDAIKAAIDQIGMETFCLTFDPIIPSSMLNTYLRSGYSSLFSDAEINSMVETAENLLERPILIDPNTSIQKPIVTAPPTAPETNPFLAIFGLDLEKFQQSMNNFSSKIFRFEVQVDPLPNGKTFAITGRAWRLGDTEQPAACLILCPRADGTYFYQHKNPHSELSWPPDLNRAVFKVVDLSKMHNVRLRDENMSDSDFREARRFAAAATLGQAPPSSDITEEAARKEMMQRFALTSPRLFDQAMADLGFHLAKPLTEIPAPSPSEGTQVVSASAKEHPSTEVEESGEVRQPTQESDTIAKRSPAEEETPLSEFQDLVRRAIQKIGVDALVREVRPSSRQNTIVLETQIKGFPDGTYLLDKEIIHPLREICEEFLGLRSSSAGRGGQEAEPAEDLSREILEEALKRVSVWDLITAVRQKTDLTVAELHRRIDGIAKGRMEVNVLPAVILAPLLEACRTAVLQSVIEVARIIVPPPVTPVAPVKAAPKARRPPASAPRPAPPVTRPGFQEPARSAFSVQELEILRRRLRDLVQTNYLDSYLKQISQDSRVTVEALRHFYNGGTMSDEAYRRLRNYLDGIAGGRIRRPEQGPDFILYSDFAVIRNFPLPILVGLSLGILALFLGYKEAGAWITVGTALLTVALKPDLIPNPYRQKRLGVSS